MTSREFHITARATATDCRWPPESVATGWRIDLIVVTRRLCERLARLRLHRRLLQALEAVVRLAAEVHVLDDVEVVAEREILVDDLDPELGRVLRAADRDLLAVEEHLALVHRVDAGDALDQRRLAGAVVADERHHLARAAPRSRRPSAPGRSRTTSRLRGARGGVCRSRGVSHTTGADGGAPRGASVRSGHGPTCSTARTSPLQTSLFFRKPDVKSSL